MVLGNEVLEKASWDSPSKEYGLRSPFVSQMALREGFLRYLRAMLEDALHTTISHASQPSHPSSMVIDTASKSTKKLTEMAPI